MRNSSAIPLLSAIILPLLVAGCVGGSRVDRGFEYDALTRSTAATPNPDRGVEYTPGTQSSEFAGASGSSFNRTSSPGSPNNIEGAPGWPFGQ